MDFNDFTQKFTEKVKKLGKDTADEVQKLNKIRQLNGKINDAKKKIESVYSEIGKKFYELHKDYIPEGFEELIETINGKTAEIEELKGQLREVKGVVLCASCNMEVSGDERFCPNCGSKMPEPVEVADEEDEDAVVVDAEEVKDAAADVVEDVKDAAADAVEGAKDMAAGAAEEVKAAAADAVEGAKEAAEDVKDAAVDVAEEVKEQAADAAKDAAADLKEKACEVAEEIAEGAKEVAGNAADEIKDAAEHLKEEAKNLF